MAGRNSRTSNHYENRLRKEDLLSSAIASDELNRRPTVSQNSAPAGRLAENRSQFSLDGGQQMRRISSGSTCPMYHFLFSFPRGKSCSRTSVWMCYRDGNHGAVKSLLSWLLGLSPALATSSITGQWQGLLALLLARTSQSETACSAQLLPESCPLSGFIWPQQKSS